MNSYFILNYLSFNCYLMTNYFNKDLVQINTYYI